MASPRSPSSTSMTSPTWRTGPRWPPITPPGWRGAAASRWLTWMLPWTGWTSTMLDEPHRCRAGDRGAGAGPDTRRGQGGLGSPSGGNAANGWHDLDALLGRRVRKSVEILVKNLAEDRLAGS